MTASTQKVTNHKEYYEAFYNPKYDFLGQSYASMYPNLHKYPATMLPQIGLELLKEFKAKKTNLLDPYCGSGSSFVAALDYDIKEFIGFDLNPLAIMISKARLTYIESSHLLKQYKILLDNIENNMSKILDFNILNNITNIDFWIEKQAQKDLIAIFNAIISIKNETAKNLFMLAFSETLREASYTRNNEFKLFRMKEYESYIPNTYKIFNRKLKNIINIYIEFYQQKLRGINLSVYNSGFYNTDKKFDTILTSPPYGDSKTTVAYGQFSTFINEWLGFKEARKLDSKMLGGIKAKKLYEKGLMKEYILEIAKADNKRALEVSSFYENLESSIKSLPDSLNIGAKVFFIVGNRRVKNIELPTDEFIAEVFCNNGFKHLNTLKRKISNKSMPLQNSPTNKIGALSRTMNEEWIVVCEKL
ncbi:modification methylase [Helicobacter sp. MIT 00-7814]|nr:50S ribosomal protein L11 methyltransferase [Helicobacter sp. MIT 00-7814]RDU52534.1 modification methylase [Helicobacter sp. MIT 00-7814]